MSLMNIGFDVIEKIGVGGLAVLILIVGFNMFKLFMEQWKNSTEAVNKNTAAFEELAGVFERVSERDARWQREVSDKLENGVNIAQDTNRRVREIQLKV